MGRNKSKEPKTCVKHFVYFTSSLALSEKELKRKLLTYSLICVYIKQRNVLDLDEKQLEMDI